MSTNLRPVHPTPSGPALDAVARTSSRIAARRPEMAVTERDAVDLAAEALTALRAELEGSATALRGARTGRYFRGQLVGERTLPVEDLARLTLVAPRAAVEALRVLARAAGYRLEPQAPMVRGLHEAVAGLDGATSEVVSSLILALADGRIDAAERRDALPKLQAAKRRLAETERAVATA